MEPRIQYAKTADGVSIAFWTLGGGGVPLVEMPGIPFAHAQLAWQFPSLVSYRRSLAEKRMLVGYDNRGSGLSDRDVTDYSLEAHVLDLEAIVDHLGLGSFGLLASFHDGPVAIAYAVRHPQRLSHLVLWCSYARASDFLRSAELRALGRLIDRNWEVYTETIAHAFMGWALGEEGHRFAEYMRECVTQEGAQTIYGAIRGFDVSALLPKVVVPTLVLQRRQLLWPDVGIARGLASRIPKARLTVLEGASGAPGLEHSEAALATIGEFLGAGEGKPGGLPEGMAVILFADIAGSTALTEQLGDAAFRAKARELDERLRSVIREAGGTPVEGKVLGDGVMAVFTSARQAIECALRCNAAAQDTGLSLHLGIHAGDVIREGNTVYGGAVNIAARIASASAPGEILVSDTVRSLARTSADVVFDDRGEHTLKGVGEPQRLFAVRGGGV